MTFEDLLYESRAIETELARLSSEDTKSTYSELRRRASRRVRHAIRDVLNGVRPRLKGYSQGEQT